MDRIYHHEVINIGGHDIGTTFNLDAIIAIGTMDISTFPVHLVNGKTIHTYEIAPGQRASLVEAWRAWLNEQAGKL